MELSKLKFKDFGLDVKNNILNPPKSECCGEYGLMKFSTNDELQHGICRLVCKSGKSPCGVAVLKRNNQIVMGFSDDDKPTEICRFKYYEIKDAPREEQYLSVGELVTRTFELENYGIMVELEDDFYQTIMD